MKEIGNVGEVRSLKYTTNQTSDDDAERNANMFAERFKLLIDKVQTAGIPMAHGARQNFPTVVLSAVTNHL